MKTQASIIIKKCTALHLLLGHLPALQISGQYTFWLCLVGSQATLKTVGRIHRRAEETREEVERL